MRPPLWLRKLARPLIPDRVMARYRLAEHSRQVRTNVDVFLRSGDPQRRRWLAATPDTYRVRPYESLPPPGDFRVLGDEPAATATACRLAAAPGVDAGVVAEVPPPRLAGRRRVEPALAPVAVAVADEHWKEVGGAPHGDLAGLLDRLRQAGRTLGLVPLSPAGAKVHRADPVEGEPAVVLALVPMHDIGGGSRGAQLTVELLRRGFHVTYAALYGTAETSDLGIRFVHPRLEQVRLDEFDADRLAARLAGPPGWVLAEAPAPPIVDVAAALAARGWDVVYDLLDDWTSPALGDWYEPAAEQRLVDLATGLVASAPDLRDRLGPDAALVPNAVNVALFGGDPGPLPDDFPQADGPVIGYHGSLYGAWMDWDGLAKLAAADPAMRVVIIGDDKAPRPELPVNVHFLGFKAQADLLGYIARFDAAIIPWEVSDLTHAVSPLKVYEYLAAGVPVAAPNLRALHGVDGVHTAPTLDQALARALAAPRPDRERALVEHSWQQRLAAMLATIGRDLPATTLPQPTIVRRPPRHYSRHERVVLESSAAVPPGRESPHTE